MSARASSVLTAAALIGLLAQGAQAADADGAFAVKGVGLTRCSDFVAAFREGNNERAAMYVGWLDGFLTASNQNREETFDLAPWRNTRTLITMLGSFCDQNADMRFGEATARLAGSLGQDRLVSRSELMPIEGDGEERVVIYKEALRRAQAALAALGLFEGDISGEFDDATRAALETFQTERELPVSGLPDQRTLHTLFREAQN